MAYANAEDPADFAKRIISLCKSPEERRSRAAAAVQANEPLSGSVNARNYADLIKGLLSRGAA